MESKASSIAQQVHVMEPTVEFRPSAGTLMSTRMRAIVDMAMELLTEHARQRSIRTTGYEVYGFVDGEAEVEDLVLRQLVALSPQAAMEYRRHALNAIESWLPTLPAPDRRIALERFVVEVRGRREQPDV